MPTMKKRPNDPRKQLSIRLNDAEYELVKAQAARAGLTCASYTKELVLKNRVRPQKQVIDRETGKALYAAINRVGNNLNQLTRHCNQTGEIPKDTAIEAIWEQLDTLIDYVRTGKIKESEESKLEAHGQQTLTR